MCVSSAAASCTYFKYLSVLSSDKAQVSLRVWFVITSAEQATSSARRIEMHLRPKRAADLLRSYEKYSSTCPKLRRSTINSVQQRPPSFTKRFLHCLLSSCSNGVASSSFNSRDTQDRGSWGYTLKLGRFFTQKRPLRAFLDFLKALLCSSGLFCQVLWS